LKNPLVVKPFSDWTISAVLLLALSANGCKQPPPNVNAVNTNSEAANDRQNYSAPPFPTKEPDRYQARMVITTNLAGGFSLPTVPPVTSREMFVARDGARRRLDFDWLGGMKLSYLEMPEGQFVLLSSRKLYASLDDASRAGVDTASAQGFSADRLLNEFEPGAKFEKLGTEEIGSRQTTKYRVTNKSRSGDGAQVSESLIWVDESLGMPIKSETVSKAEGTEGRSKYSMELLDVRQELESDIFEIPRDFKRLTYSQFMTEARSSTKGKNAPQEENRGVSR
jgi:hypothetical protein